MTTRINRELRAGLIGILAVFMVLVAVVFIVTSNEVNHVRGDFCVFAGQVQAGARKLPQVPGRVQAEHAYTQLQGRLGC